MWGKNPPTSNINAGSSNYIGKAIFEVGVMPDKRIVIGLALVIALVIAGAGFVAIQEQPKSNTINLAINKVPLSVLVFIAEEKGFFAEEGLNVVMHEFSSGKTSIDAMLAGGAEMSTVADFPIALAGMAEQEFYVVASMGQGDDIKVIARRDSGIISIADLKGKRIATKKGSGGELFMINLFSKEEISLGSVNLIYLNPPEMPAAIARDDVDAYIVWEPHITNGANELGENAIVFSPKGIYGETWNIAARKDFADRNPEKVKAFLRALLKADEFFRKNREAGLEIAERHSGASLETVKAILDEFEIRVSLGDILRKQVLDAAEFAVEQGIVKEREIPSFDGIFNTAFLEEISPETVESEQK